VSARERAFAKVNLCLFMGGRRADGRHELVTLFESVSLADELTLELAPAAPTGSAAMTGSAGSLDEVVCPGVEGPNLVTAALAALRAGGWRAPVVRVHVTKRIPVAAGMGGGSADAGATLRLAARVAAVAPAELAEIAAGLGSDVPSQLDPGPSLGTGAGELVAPVGQLPDHAVLVLPQPFGLSTAEVYREADRLGLGRGAQALASLRAELQTALRAGDRETPMLPERLILNDLQPASLSLRPEIGDALACARDAGADQALVCGSGPTVIGLFWGRDGLVAAGAAAARLRDRFPGAAAVEVVRRGVPASAAND
jgi:4-diphosphocytidyl-2-C-methyl-D-erythritol kinase